MQYRHRHRGDRFEIEDSQQPASQTFKSDFGQIVAHANKKGASGVFARLQARPETITINEGKTIQDFSYNPKTKTLTIHTRSGLEVAPGQVQTPALGTIHEAGHAEAALINPAGEQKDFQTHDAAYDNVAEKKVIQNVETPAATKMGEPTRNNHGGKAVQVSCPTCDK